MFAKQIQFRFQLTNWAHSNEIALSMQFASLFYEWNVITIRLKDMFDTVYAQNAFSHALTSLSFRPLPSPLAEYDGSDERSHRSHELHSISSRARTKTVTSTYLSPYAQ